MNRAISYSTAEPTRSTDWLSSRPIKFRHSVTTGEIVFVAPPGLRQIPQCSSSELTTPTPLTGNFHRYQSPWTQLLATAFSAFANTV
jgi:hypothetical protein